MKQLSKKRLSKVNFEFSMETNNPEEVIKLSTLAKSRFKLVNSLKVILMLKSNNKERQRQKLQRLLQQIHYLRHFRMSPCNQTLTLLLISTSMKITRKKKKVKMLTKKRRMKMRNTMKKNLR